MMELTTLQQQLAARLPDIKICNNEPMSRHTSFRIGGPAEAMVFPKSVEELASLLKESALLDCNVAILGAGTNVLAPDRGIDGIVICLKDTLKGFELLGENRIRVMAGMTMRKAALLAAENCLEGMEFAHGIPGTVGGGIYMNAGAYGGEISQICESVTLMDRQGNLRTIDAAQMEFSYRHSVLEGSDDIVVSAVFQLKLSREDVVRDRMRELMWKRGESQPLDLPSAGSAFKRPAVGYAAALIDEAGLKGFRVGDAAISEKHAGFAVNLGNATAEDVKSLLEQVSQKVFEKSGIRIEPEIRIW